ncbi:hypothetical protein JIQ42_07008 [Leishmania sp. Namibia]|uniref:hypothetical protein n=1 Tax=Leishmania sp. Namibia TaxID=2802991 RepID=UPI001B699BAF|nr:hypothetical protein JIQ42_07008 [Leishmania sp. Namibia]
MLTSPRHKTESASHPSARTGATMLRSASLLLMSVKIVLTCAQSAHPEAASTGRRGLHDRLLTSEVAGSGGGTGTMGTSWSALPCTVAANARRRCTWLKQHWRSHPP